MLRIRMGKNSELTVSRNPLKIHPTKEACLSACSTRPEFQILGTRTGSTLQGQGQGAHKSNSQWRALACRQQHAHVAPALALLRGQISCLSIYTYIFIHTHIM